MAVEHETTGEIETRSVEISRNRLETISKMGSLSVEKGNALHDLLARIEQDKKVGLRAVELNFGNGVSEIAYQVVQPDTQNSRIYSEIYSRDIIREVSDLLLVGEIGQNYINEIDELTPGEVIPIPFNISK